MKMQETRDISTSTFTSLLYPKAGEEG